MVERWHYLASAAMVGGLLKYFISLGGHIVGAISFSTGAYHLGPRDKYIGWNEKERLANLHLLVENNRFLIFPWVKVKNLASATLALAVNHLQQDWLFKYGVRPALIETYVDTARFSGTSYRAANWEYLGQSKGYSRDGRWYSYHGQSKGIYVLVIDKDFARKYQPSTDRLPNPVKEIYEMINGVPHWSPNILEKLGLSKLTDNDIRQELAEHIETYTPFLGRIEHIRHLTIMIQGLLSDLKRKTIEPIALAFAETKFVRLLTKFMSAAKWSHEDMKTAYQAELAGFLAEEGGMLTADDTCVPKKGKKSVGVDRQYCGSTGKIDNCQTIPMVGYVSSKGYGICDWDLYLTKKWLGDSHADLRRQCKIPQSTVFKTKNQQMLEMIQQAHASGQFAANYVGVDSFYGSDSQFLDALPKELIYFADVRKSQRVFAQRPELVAQGKRGKLTPASKPVTVEELVAQDPAPYNEMVLGIGSKGPIFSKDKAIAVVEVRDGLPGKDVWLYVRQLEDGSLKYSLTNVEATASLAEIRKPALMRWSIEQCFKELKDYLGMDHYETRNWLAFHRYILLANIAHLFINKLRAKFASQMSTPSVTPYIDAPVSNDDFLDAAIELAENRPISKENIYAMPPKPQQILTIGLIQKIINFFLIKVGSLWQEIDYYLKSSAQSFESFTRSSLEKAHTKRAARQT